MQYIFGDHASIPGNRSLAQKGSLFIEIFLYDSTHLIVHIKVISETISPYNDNGDGN